MGVHSGVPRATLDVDFAVPTSVPRGKLIEQFTQRRFRLRDIALLEGDVPEPHEGW
ncbi:MAG TPA: hypothetical protein VGI10_09765 [Polyangiaceae bacterium]